MGCCRPASFEKCLSVFSLIPLPRGGLVLPSSVRSCLSSPALGPLTPGPPHLVPAPPRAASPPYLVLEAAVHIGSQRVSRKRLGYPTWPSFLFLPKACACFSGMVSERAVVLTPLRAQVPKQASQAHRTSPFILSPLKNLYGRQESVMGRGENPRARLGSGSFSISSHDLRKTAQPLSLGFLAHAIGLKTLPASCISCEE